ncbi:hypothetical protein HGG71_15715 [Rhodobacteraceae bacterium R_SAG2]|nr:hypothetical protein [Rhodobacteraceae bacterium R_SAG2]
MKEYAKELASAVDDEWSEEIRILPMRDGEPDPERTPLELLAVLRTGERREERYSFGSRAASLPGIAASGGTLKIRRSDFPALDVQKDDKVVALDRHGEPVFLVRMVDDRSHHRIILQLEDAN